MVALLRIHRVHAPGGDVAGASDIYVTLRQDSGGVYLRTPVQLDNDTVTVQGEFLFRDSTEPVRVVVWDADYISADDALERYDVSLDVAGTHRLEADRGYLEYEVEHVDLVAPARYRELRALEAAVGRFEGELARARQ